ncbi:MAG: biopolymer transporter ExbD [Calditrichota bacterium]
MAFAPTKGKKHLVKSKEALSLTSMMDMMTIILVFLLKTFSTSGALLQPSKFVDLPSASRNLEPQKMMSLLVNPDYGILQGEADATGAAAPSPADIISSPEELNEELSDEQVLVLPGLDAYLTEQRERSKGLFTGFNGQITLQCDSAVTYDWLLKIISTCGQNEYATIDFVVIKKP